MGGQASTEGGRISYPSAPNPQTHFPTFWQSSLQGSELSSRTPLRRFFALLAKPACKKKLVLLHQYTCTPPQYGCLVVNAPTANTVAAAEHSIALLCSMARNIPQADASMKAGKWDRQAYVGTSLSGKILVRGERGRERGRGGGGGGERERICVDAPTVPGRIS